MRPSQSLIVFLCILYTSEWPLAAQTIMQYIREAPEEAFKSEQYLCVLRASTKNAIILLKKIMLNL